MTSMCEKLNNLNNEHNIHFDYYYYGAHSVLRTKNIATLIFRVYFALYINNSVIMDLDRLYKWERVEERNQCLYNKISQ